MISDNNDKYDIAVESFREYRSQTIFFAGCVPSMLVVVDVAVAVKGVDHRCTGKVTMIYVSFLLFKLIVFLCVKYCFDLEFFIATIPSSTLEGDDDDIHLGRLNRDRTTTGCSVSCCGFIVVAYLISS